MKDKKWLQDSITRVMQDLFSTPEPNYFDFEKANKRTRELIDQLEEPEVLSQELPSVPQFVAEWYESEGKRSSWWNWFYKWGRDESRTELETKTIRWMQDFNEELFVNMFLHGYTVEKEQKYYVRENNYLLCKWENEVMDYVEAIGREITDLVELKLTEQEIKDYDPRYLAFKVPVEDVEE